MTGIDRTTAATMGGRRRLEFFSAVAENRAEPSSRRETGTGAGTVTRPADPGRGEP